jgi:long-chain acyl-CoA synthetase
MAFSSTDATLDVTRTLRGARVLILGGTGFLGKVFWAMLLDRYPVVDRIYLVVRPKAGATPDARFWSEIAGSEALGPLRRAHGDGYDAFLREKIVPIDGDMARPRCGIDEALVRELAGTIDAVINVAGVVDFNPPLDDAIAANAHGAQNLVALTRALTSDDRPTAVLHTSTCYVAGSREGPIYEEDPRTHPFPRCGELGADAWDPDREIAECLDLVEQAKHRSDDAFRQSEFAEVARKNLASRGEPVHGPAYESELGRVKRRFVSDRIIEGGLDRATHWGWPTIYTYTKSIGEQVIARSGLRFSIARPACCESCIEFPERSYSEGINTSSPLIYLIMKGQTHILAQHVPLDLVPTDYVVAGMILALAELLEGTAPPVYQFGASDVNPCSAQRFGEMAGMYKRKFLQRGGGGNPLVAALAARIEPTFVDRAQFERVGPPAIASAARSVASIVRSAVPALAPAAKALENAATGSDKIASLQRLFAPFAAKVNGPFDCSNTRAAYARATDDDKQKLRWTPESLDWLDWMMNVHMPAIEKRVIPELDGRLKKTPRPITAHETIVTLVDEMAERHDLSLALQQVTSDGLTRTTFRDVKRGADAAAARLAALGVSKGDRVVLAAQSRPDWAIAYFGIVRAGATAVPIDPGLDAPGWAAILAESEARAIVWDETVVARAQVASSLGALLAVDLLAITELPLPSPGEAPLAPPAITIEPGDVASLLYTSGTTARPKGVMLTHANFTSLVAALAPIFPLARGDAALSVLPLHHTFEFTCGLLLPLTRGARVVYVGERTGDGIAEGLRAARATAMVGVPALWQLLERRILQQVDARGPMARAAFDAAAEANRWLSANLGIDAGRVLFGAVHGRLGGHMKWLISGGAALPRETQELFFGLGLRLTQGYGLTEAAPVLTVARPSKRLEAGVGQAVPGVELRIDRADDQGIGEVVARGANVMVGYTDPDATREAIDTAGWLHTGDVGRIDKKGRLEILGRLKDVVIAPNGENLYPDDIERRLGAVPHVEELAVVGVELRGGERLACLAVPAAAGDRAARNDRARAALRAAIDGLPPAQRPAIVHLYEAALPRTGTRKVKRDEVRAILTRLAAASARPENGAGAVSPARAAIAAVCGVGAREIGPHATLHGELGFDSLLLTELLEALETRFGPIDSQRLQACLTVADVDDLVSASSGARAAHAAPVPVRAPAAPIVLPEPVQAIGRALLGKAQDLFYGEVMKPRVFGRSHIPHNRNVIVIANHTSHLDMGLVRHALGPYGEDITSLAAQDYFFEGRVKRAFFENLTNLRAIDRKASLRQSIRQASDLLERGKTLLIFPEGTRSGNGDVQDFKPLVGHLALTNGVDLLPMYLGGTHAAMPKGAPVPTRRDVVARIGPPLCVADLRRLTAEMTPADAAREVARVARAAVAALRDGQVLDLGRLKGADVPADAENPLIELFAELETKFRAGEAPRPLSYYVSLGNDELAKWTVRVDAARCHVRPGKPEGGEADCVLKTSPEIFAKIVRESYVPSPADFMSGVFKSNDVALLMTFQRVFQLDTPS